MAAKRKATKLTAKQEAFAVHYAMNGDASAAYRAAYSTGRMKKQVINNEASKLLGNHEVAVRVASLQNRKVNIAEQKFDVTVERVLQELAALAFANSEDYFEWGTYEKPVFNKKGDPVCGRDGKQIIEDVPYVKFKPSCELSRTQKKAITAVNESISRTGDRVVEVKMSDKRAALVDLARHLGMFEKDNAIPVDVKVTYHERIARIRERLAIDASPASQTAH